MNRLLLTVLVVCLSLVAPVAAWDDVWDLNRTSNITTPAAEKTDMDNLTALAKADHRFDAYEQGLTTGMTLARENFVHNVKGLSTHAVSGAKHVGNDVIVYGNSFKTAMSYACDGMKNIICDLGYYGANGLYSAGYYGYKVLDYTCERIGDFYSFLWGLVGIKC